jgi:hypothetical protein
MEQKTLAKIILVAGIILIVVSLWIAWLMFAMRDGPISGGVYALTAVLLGAGIILLVIAKKVYGRA